MHHRSLPIALVVLAASCGSASAHAHLKTSTPAAGAVVTAPAEIDLAFTEGVNLKFTGIALAGPGSATVSTRPGRFGSGGTATLMVPVPTKLVPGAYKVDWHALAVDGHKTEGSFTFTVTP